MNERALLYCAGGGLGDSLVASVLARALRGRYKSVDALTLPGHRETLERVPDIDEVSIDDGAGERELAERLSEREYDAVIVSWATARTARVAQLARVPVRVGQSRRLYSWRFTHRVPIRSESGDVTSHWTQILLDYARAIGCDTTDATPRFIPTPQDELEAAALARELGYADGAYAIVHPANAIASERSWPLEGWTRLAQGLRVSLGVPVAITGAPADRELTERIAAQSGAASVAGRLSIGAFGAFARNARVFTGITTGTMHVAAACGAATVGIFPFQTDTPDRWAPLGRRTAVVRASYPCRPGERKETCPDYACIAHLDEERIVAAARLLLAVESGAHR